ncbi:hypothetical protein BpOF4_18155 [Alkalihalophilus pseudofirmus OF4]|uniref:Lipoprotein n=1 Tax=Alkalihalophilus pseudofirmus (strain ATCC BAA-2126 / JCM 17055 / OF4) TaxID=398511 RepID=D3FS37_ALKPO|nr:MULTISPECIES: hypothetical protein [Alkalihalophilus]ADC51672.1 hypothetical protein BpOF4_18155 [Alkalihalophilus pseudofirmus OF4]MED1600416.1 hypothetical protein [Alkalihalophilus marmarensis]
MKKAIGIGILFMLFLILTACGKDTVKFSGQGDQWEATYTAHIYEENSEQTEFLIRYLGEDPPATPVDFEIGSISGNGWELNENGSLSSSGSSCSGCAVTTRDDRIEFTIEWDGQTESFVLENVN